MEKVRVYELAKELNTTSKRLIEKLAEINIVVKNHMSLLEDHELDALYKHIGVIQHEDNKKVDTEEKKSAPAVQPKVEPKKEVKKDIKSAPRIIRTTEIIIDTKKEDKAKSAFDRMDTSRDASMRDRGDTDKGAGQRRSSIKVSDASSGLRAGFVRDTRPDYLRDLKPFGKPGVNKDGGREAGKPERKPEESRSETKVVQPSLSGGEQAHAMKPEEKQEAKIPVDKVEKQKIEDRPERVEKSEQAGVKKEERNLQSQDQADHVPQSNLAKDDARPGNNESKSVRPSPKNQEGQNSVQQAYVRQEAWDSPRQGGVRTREAVVPGRQGLGNADRRPKSPQRPVVKPLEIPKPELTAVQKEELSIQRSESRREFYSKDTDKDVKREQKREMAKGQAVAGKARKFKPQTVVLSEKKGVSEILSEDFILDEFYSDDGMKKTKKAVKPKKDFRSDQKEKHVPPKPVTVTVKIPESITVKDLAEVLKKTSTDVIKKLMGLGLMVTLNEEIDFDTAAIIADEYNIVAEKEVVINEEDILFDDTEDANDENLKPRPPVVVVMGHVDHGKTSLLDAIRKTNVIDSEAGGITQHIGAYTVTVKNRNITFLDTPGHEAFTAMRARGAQVTDIAILVVAADDGVMPQTVEAINHAKAANVSIIVAINKIDKPGANPERVKQELTEHGLLVEEWGGDIIAVPVSAKMGQNIDQLLEMVLLTADMLELKANPEKQAKGTIIEAKLDKTRGPIATLLVQRGTLRIGDAIVAGTTVGRIRAMIDDKGNNIKEAGPSIPVEILGLPEVPEAGEIFYVIKDEKVARQLAEKRRQKQKEEQQKSTARVSLDDLFNQIKEGKVKDLNIIVKADVQGSVEAIKQSIEKLSNDEVHVKIIHGGVGAITESDVTLAQISNAIIIGFNVRPGVNVAEAAENAGVDMRLYRIIYDAIEDIQAAMKGLLDPMFKEVVLGHAEIRQIFKVSGVGTIGGCYVTDGKIVRNSDVRLVRNGIVVHEGKLASLKRFKDDAKEVLQGFECGLSLEKFNDLKEGDVVESYVMEEVAR